MRATHKVTPDTPDASDTHSHTHKLLLTYAHVPWAFTCQALGTALHLG